MLEYVEEFERVSAPLKDAPEACLIAAFRQGLKPEIRAELKLTMAVTLRETMETAVRIEEKNGAVLRAKENEANKDQCFSIGPKPNLAHSPPTQTRSHYVRVSQVTETPKAPIPAASFTTSSQKPIAKTSNIRTASGASAVGTSSHGGSSRLLSDAEILRRRELGLCYKCAEKYSPNHICKNKHLQVILLEMDPADDPGGNKTEEVVLDTAP